MYSARPKRCGPERQGCASLSLLPRGEDRRAQRRGGVSAAACGAASINVSRFRRNSHPPLCRSLAGPLLCSVTQGRACTGATLRLRRTGAHPLEAVGYPQHFPIATPCFRIWPLLVSGKRGTGPSLSNFSTWRGLRAPPVFFPQPARRPCRGTALPCGATPTGNTAPVSRAGLGGSSPSGAPLRHQPGTGASLRYPVRTEFPWKRTRRISEVRRVGMKIFVVERIQGLWKKAENYLHGIRALGYDEPPANGSEAQSLRSVARDDDGGLASLSSASQLRGQITAWILGSPLRRFAPAPP